MLACDVQLAGTDATVSVGFRRVGLSIDSGVSYLLPRYVGQSTAKELVFTGEVLDADRARELGLSVRRTRALLEVGVLALGYLMGGAVGLGTVLTLLQGLRVGYGYVEVEAPLEPVVVRLLWRYNLGVYWIVVVSLAVLPRMIEGVL
jgi:hypothetical protein